MQELVQVITGLVEPRNRADLQLNLHHQTQLYGFKSAKRLTRKRLTVKCKTLTRRQATDLGMFTLPTAGMRYADMEPLHALWLDYMRQHLGVTATVEGGRAPEPHESGYDNFAKLLAKSDFHGAAVRVVRSKCPGHVGTEGIVAMDTKNTFKVVGRDNRMRSECVQNMEDGLRWLIVGPGFRFAAIPKQDSVFRICIDRLECTLFGRHLGIRPAERSVKKIKNFMDLDL